MENPTFHLVLIRHAEATSNVSTSSQDGIDIRSVKKEELHQVLLDIATGTSTKTFKNGDYLPDGLTQFGLDSAEAFCEEARNDPSKKLPTSRVITSPLTRAAATAKATSDKFEALDDGGLVCSRSLREITNWPQDLPPHEPTTTFIKLQGGPTCDAGAILGEQVVNLGNTWDEKNLCGLEDRLQAVEKPASFEERVEDAKKFRQYLREQGPSIVRQHGKRAGTPKVVIFTHGGMFNLLVGKWYCSYQRKDHFSDWEWAGSTVLPNLGVVVFRFMADDDDARMEEVPESLEYKRIFGDHYRHLGVVEYINPDGGVVDQRRGHRAFAEKTRDDVVETLHQQRDIMSVLLRWLGAKSAAQSLGRNC